MKKKDHTTTIFKNADVLYNEKADILIIYIKPVEMLYIEQRGVKIGESKNDAWFMDEDGLFISSEEFISKNFEVIGEF